MARFIWDKRQEDWVPIETFTSQKVTAGLQLIPDVESFVSPVTNEVIGGRRQLREHNRVHDVVDRRDLVGHKFETPRLPPVAPELARAWREQRRG